MKAKAKHYRGIEYVVVSDLPADQQERLDQKNVERIKILIDGKIVSNCISFKDYTDWFLTTYKQPTTPVKPVEEEIIRLKIAFNKA